MKSIYLVLFAAIVLVSFVSANWLDDLEERMVEEQIEELAQRSLDDDDDDDLYRRVLEAKRNNKDYLTAKKHPQRLRDCVVCVGIERQKGFNVKQATANCNKTCKRNIFDSRAFEEDFSDK